LLSCASCLLVIADTTGQLARRQAGRKSYTTLRQKLSDIANANLADLSGHLDLATATFDQDHVAIVDVELAACSSSLTPPDSSHEDRPVERATRRCARSFRPDLGDEDIANANLADLSGHLDLATATFDQDHVAIVDVDVIADTTGQLARRQAGRKSYTTLRQKLSSRSRRRTLA
jgi:DNA polymerase III epsilon subunit-like protein